MEAQAKALAGSGVGRSVLRKEDDRFLRGRGQYVGDIWLDKMQEVAFVRSPVAHARLIKVEIPEQYRDAVFTAEHLDDVKPIVSAPPEKSFKRSAQPILATKKLRYVGELVAMCVAPTRAEAEDIAQSVTLEFEELPAVVDMLLACKPDAPLVHDEWSDNRIIEFRKDAAIEEVAKTADVRIHRHIRTSRHCMFPMEGRGVIGYRDARLRYLTIISSTQFPHCVQTGLCEALSIPDGDIRVISPDVGGGFGYKGILSCEEVAIAWLARRLDFPVRWLEDCREHLGANANCREHDYEITCYASKDGKLLAVDCVAHVDAGAYSAYPVSSSVEAAQVANLLPGPYILPAYRGRSIAVATNKCPILPYRGVARPGVCLAIEACMDAIAFEIGIEPYEVRLRNLVQPEKMTARAETGKTFDSGNHPECIDRAVRAVDYAKIRDRQKRGESDGRLIGVGLSFFVEQGAMGTSVMAGWGRPIVPGYEQANVKLTADGDLEVRVGTHSHGQGHETTFAQVAHEILGVEFDRIKVMQGDTANTPYSTATWGSRAMVMGGGAVAAASRKLAERIAAIGAWLLQAELADVKVADGRVVGNNNSVSLRDVARCWYLQPQHLPPEVDRGGLEVTEGYKPKSDLGTFSYAAHAAVVAVDPATGLVEILDYVVVEDGGTMVNPMIVDGQISGGTVQGIGSCLYEATPFDGQGQPLASTLIDYILPGATEAPNIRIFHMETPSPNTEFGIKGIGEGGAVGPPGALVCAINDALRARGAAVYHLPVTPERILQAIQESSGQASSKQASSTPSAELRTSE
jgi:aerobic carbon-monoxide dehydrogenase large subunit